MQADSIWPETREQLGGFFLIDAKDLDEAIDIAARIPAGRWGTVEIRPVMEITGLPAERTQNQTVKTGAERRKD